MNVTNCNSQGDIIKYDMGENKPVNYTFAALKHYYTKSVEEYAQKTKRGDSFIYFGFDESRKKKQIRRYFGYNNYSLEKEYLFKKLFNLKMNSSIYN